MPQNSTIVGTVDAIAFGGEGIVRHQGQVVFVPYTAIGDRISAHIHTQKKSFARAKLVQLHDDSPHRIKPKCSHFLRCGGCSLQHMGYEEQLRVKERFVKDAVQRMAGLSQELVQPIVAAEPAWFYRRHIRLHAYVSKKSIKLGFIADDQKSIIPIDSCAIFHPDSSAIFSALKDLLKMLQLFGEGEIKLYKARQGKFVVALDFSFPLMPDNLTLASESPIQGIVLSNGQEFFDCSLSFDLKGLTIAYSARCFVQAHGEQSENIYMQLRDTIAATNVKKVLDLYCGIGVTSLLLAQAGLQVYGVEINEHAIELARKNAVSNGLSTLRFSAQDVDENLTSLLADFKPEAVVVNPPRTGLSLKLIDALSDYKPRYLAYISCMPQTLARDIKRLSELGYILDNAIPFDMFPMTTHVETLAVLRLNK